MYIYICSIRITICVYIYICVYIHIYLHYLTPIKKVGSLRDLRLHSPEDTITSQPYSLQSRVINPSVREARMFPMRTLLCVVSPRGSVRLRFDVPLLMGTKVLQTVAHITKKLPRLPFSTVDRANLSFWD